MQPEPIFFFPHFCAWNSWPIRIKKKILTLYFTSSLKVNLLKGAIFNLATTLFFHVRIPHVILTLLEAISLGSTCFSHSSNPRNLSVYSTVFAGKVVELSLNRYLLDIKRVKLKNGDFSGHLAKSSVRLKSSKPIESWRMPDTSRKCSKLDAGWGKIWKSICGRAELARKAQHSDEISIERNHYV